MQILLLPVRLSHRTLKPIFNLHNRPEASPIILNYKNQGTKSSMRNYKSCPSKSERSGTAGEQFYSSHEIPPLLSLSFSLPSEYFINKHQSEMDGR